MQKTRLGISVGLFGTLLYMAGLYGGYLITILLAGYVLLFEENEWLKKSAIKAVALMVLFSVVSSLIYLLPNVVNFIGDVIGVFGGGFYFSWLSNLANTIQSALNIIETILFIGLGVKALNQGDIAVPVVDKLIGKYMG